MLVCYHVSRPRWHHLGNLKIFGSFWIFTHILILPDLTLFLSFFSEFSRFPMLFLYVMLCHYKICIQKGNGFTELLQYLPCCVYNREHWMWHGFIQPAPLKKIIRYKGSWKSGSFFQVPEIFRSCKEMWETARFVYFLKSFRASKFLQATGWYRL